MRRVNAVKNGFMLYVRFHATFITPRGGLKFSRYMIFYANDKQMILAWNNALSGLNHRGYIVSLVYMDATLRPNGK